MGRKGNWAEKLGSVVSEKIAEAGGLDGIINSYITEDGKAEGMKTTAELTKTSRWGKNKKIFLIAKTLSHSEAARAEKIKRTVSSATSSPKKFLRSIFSSDQSLSDMVSPEIALSEGEYHVYRVEDTNGNLKYIVDSRASVSDVFDVRDAKGTLIGSIKYPWVSIGDLFERNVQDCTITYKDNKLCELHRSISFGDFSISTYDGPAKVQCYNNGIAFEVKFNKKKIAKINAVPKLLKNGYADRFVLEYYDMESEHLAVLFSVAVDTLRLN